MKSVFKKLISVAAGSDRLWSWLDATLLETARYAESERAKARPFQHSAALEAVARPLLSDLVVKHGPFQGMKYPQAESLPGSLYPKLLGSYEREIQPVVETTCHRSYAHIINIGCGDGYYAVGYAMRVPSATVHAYDLDPGALDACQRMARANHVERRVVVGSSFTIETLTSFPFAGKALVVCDCEGCEKALFTEDGVRAVADHDLLIEVHDFVDPEISSLLRQAFQRTHHLEVIPSVDDVRKARTYDYEELRGVDLKTRRRLLAETRPGIMEWFSLTSRATDQGHTTSVAESPRT